MTWILQCYPDGLLRQIAGDHARGGLPERLIRATASHGYGITVDIEPEHQMEKVLYARRRTDRADRRGRADCGPSKSVMDLEVKSVMKKFKRPASRRAVPEVIQPRRGHAGLAAWRS